MDNTHKLTELRWVDPMKLSRDEYKWIEKFCKSDPIGRKPEWILKCIMDRKLTLWSWGSGVVATSVADHGGVRELFVDILAGIGYIEIIDEIFSDLQMIAKFSCCHVMGATFLSQALANKYVERGGEIKGYYGTFPVGGEV